jgi:glycosyltransferase involved in cell wall biosynthesis
MDENTQDDSPAPDISIVICTHNRATYLDKALQSLADQDPVSREVEIIVVDNASTDNTPAVVDRFVTSSGVRYIHEPTLGLCVSRNTGWRKARGRYIAYFDDDAVAAPGWIAAIGRAFDQHPNAGIVGGPARPIWGGERPDWLGDELLSCLTVIDWADTDHVIEDVGQQWLVGANMAVRREILAELGGFHPQLDRVGTNLLSGGDVYLQKKIIEKGHDCVYVPDMEIGHLVTESRLSQSWFRRRYYWQGISDYAAQRIEENPGSLKRIGSALRLTGEILGSKDALSSVLLPTDDPERFTKKCFTLIKLGHIAALVGLAKSS